MEEAVDHEKRIILGYMNDPALLMKHLEEHNEMLAQLNEKVLKIYDYSPKINIGVKDDDGSVKILGQKIDHSSHELLLGLKRENEEKLRQAFPDLYVFTDHLNKNNGEINNKILE